jgi:hypothetical protein
MANLYDKAGLVNIPVGYQDGFLYNIKPEDNTLGFRFNRDSAATRVNKEGLIEQVGYFGPELVKNGNFSELGSEIITPDANRDFSSNTGYWTLEAGVTIGNGKLNFSNTANNRGFYKLNLITSGKTYKLEITISGYVEGFIDSNNGNNFTFPSSNGTHTVYFVGGNPHLVLSANGTTTLSLDSISIKEVDPNNYWTLGTGWSFGDNLISLDTSNAYVNFNQTIGTVINKTYKITYTLSNYSSGAVQYIIGNAGARPQGQLRSADGTYSETFTIDSSTVDANKFFIRGGASGFTGSISNISVVEVLGDKPRIDYTDSLTSPSFLLEPQSTNLVEFSEDFTQWSIAGSGTQISTVTNQKNPSGNNQSGFITFSSSVSTIKLVFIFTSSSSSVHSYSVFVKYHSKQWIQLNTSLTHANFDVKNGVLGSFNGCVPSIENYGNGWYKLSMVTNNAVNPITCILANIDDGTAGSPAASTSTGSYYVWGAQLEASPYPTSYIPTAGSTATRAQETCNGAGNASTFNSTEGVLYAEIAALSSSDSINPNRNISISDGTVNNTAIFYYQAATNKISYIIIVGGSVVASGSTTLYTVTNFNKIALKWKQNDFSLYINGSEVFADTSGSSYSSGTLSKVNFDNGAGNDDFYGKVKGIYVFNEALTDDELQQLTGPEYNSFAALAAAYNYTVI